jgi:hypothetical protein
MSKFKHQVKQVRELVAKEVAYVKTKHTQRNVVMVVYKLRALVKLLL